MNVIKKNHQKKYKKYFTTVEKINSKEKHFERFTDEQLKHKTVEFKELLHKGKTIQDIAVDAFATVREVSKRILGLRHYDVQLVGGLALLEGNVAEMATGEGK